MRATTIALIVLAAKAERAPIPLPSPDAHGVIHLDARPYVQGSQGSGYVSIIGQPGATIQGGLHWSGGFPSLGGSIHFDGGEISSYVSTVAISGENMSIVNCSLESDMGVSFSGHVSIADSSVTVTYGRGIHVHNATIRITNSYLTPSDDGYFEMFNSTATMEDVEVKQVFSAAFKNSVLNVTGNSFLVGQTDFGPFEVSFDQTLATFEHGKDVITTADLYQQGIRVSLSRSSSVIFKNCTSLARAIHNSTTVGNVSTGPHSRISCIPGDQLLLV